MLKLALLLLSAVSCLSQPFTLRNQSRVQIDTLLSGKNDTNRQWRHWSKDYRLNTNAWSYPLDFTGVAMNLRSALVTKRHAIAAAHSPPSVGFPVMFLDRSNVVHAATVQSVTASSNDLCVVTFESELPDCIRPFKVMPANFTNWFENGSIGWSEQQPRPVEGIWFRPNSEKVNVKPIIWSGPPYALMLSHNRWSPPIFTEGNPTSGDSGGPAFILINGEPVLLFCTYGTPGPAGPLVSEPWHLEFIQSVCGTNALRFANLNRYEKPE